MKMISVKKTTVLATALLAVVSVLTPIARAMEIHCYSTPGGFVCYVKL